MDYYANSTDLQSDECELLLKLDCTFSLLPPTDREKWNYATPTEAKAMCPEVLDIEIIRDANVCKQQHEQSKSRS